MEAYKTQQVHISDLMVGDTLLIDGKMKTLNFGLISKGFLGWTYEGQPFRETEGKVDVVLFPKFYKGELKGYYRGF